MGGQASLKPLVHAVSFYVHHKDVVGELVRFVAEGAEHGGRAVVIATPRHRRELLEKLWALARDPDQPLVADHLVLLDARETLESFTTASGLLDPDLFAAGVGKHVVDAGADGAPVRVVGEMVGLLWRAGDVHGAIALEAMWNGLIARLDFDLLCAYPASLIEASSLLEVRAVCDHHSSVQARQQVVPASDHAGASRMFLPVPESVSTSRNFVLAALGRLGADHLAHDASVIVSELATNAVRHAGSPFRVTVDATIGNVCISVQDVGDGHAAPPTIAPDEHALEGRGMAIIDALAQRWGCDLVDDGKVVWAQLAS